MRTPFLTSIAVLAVVTAVVSGQARVPARAPAKSPAPPPGAFRGRPTAIPIFRAPTISARSRRSSGAPARRWC